jgi:hypothetical protein
MGTSRISLRVGARVVAVAACALWVALAPAPAKADGSQMVRERLAPRPEPMGAPIDAADVREPAAPAWMPEEAVEREREHAAASVGEAYVADQLDAWLDGTPFEALARLRHTDFVLTGGGTDSTAPGPAAAAPPRGLDVRLRVAEKLRLTVAHDAFRRDLLYDPIRGRMSMDLFTTSLPNSDTGVALTESYEVGDGANRLLLSLHHSLE